ncbi:6277_t:CDS:10 [Diversispora eburnea]|uniref:U3 small nucleolar RNA-associated protein 22 n=1 Tax=Diversispora eburnea TaxID=1213867 RepID=A0A9N8V1K6_9GLOM|nr:6277_t:CDS:10 [Diversispora eburnea]
MKTQKRKLNPNEFTEEDNTPNKRVSFSPALVTTATYHPESAEENDISSENVSKENEIDPIKDAETLTNTSLNSISSKGLPDELIAIREGRTPRMMELTSFAEERQLAHLQLFRTAEEIQKLRQTGLYKSNLYKLQIEELIGEVSIDFTRVSRLDNALYKLREIFMDMNDKIDLTLSNAKSILLNKYNIVIPFPDPQPSDVIQYKFGFRKPTAFYLIGSYALRNVIKGRKGFNVDVAVVMPSSIFQEKDYMNYRYFYKRAYYLSVLAATLQENQSDFNVKVEFDTLNGDTRCPIIILKPSGDDSETDYSKLNCVIQIIPCIPKNLFPSHRLSPTHNNVRPRYNQQNQIEEQQDQKDKEEHEQPDKQDNKLPPTPQYNSAILKDMNYLSHLNLIYRHSKDKSAFIDASKLAKVWITQRGFGDTFGFNAFLWSMLMTYLFHEGGPNGGKKLLSGFSSYQLFKGTMDFLATHDFIKNPIFMNKSDKSEEFSEKSFTENYEVVFVDDSGELNLFSGMTKANFKHVTKLAMEYLNDPEKDGFEELFLQKVDDMKVKYDNFVKVIKIPSTYKEYTDSVKLDYPDIFIHFAQSIQKLLERGLTNHEIAVKEFRELWGNKAETRRFKDGNILECAVWESKNIGIESRSLIINEMVLHLLNFHYGINEINGNIQYFASQLNEFIIPSSFVPKKIFDRNINGFQPIMKAYDELVKQFLSLENIPLKITNVKSISSSLRYSSVFIPQPYNLQNDLQKHHEKFNGIIKHEDNHDYNNIIMNSHYIEPIEIQFQFEVSLKWPNDLVAIQKMKLAFYIKISDQLKVQFPGIITKIVVVESNNQNKIFSLDEYLEIFTTSGFAFRCRIYYEREIPMLERLIKDPNISKQKKDVYKNALKIEKHLFIDLPLLNSQIQTLCNKYPSLSLTIRITKRWFMANLFEGQVDEEFIEVLCAFIYLEPRPWTRPATGFVGFLRILKLIAEIRKKFDNSSNDRGLMFVATTSGIIWGLEKPNKVVSRRIQDLAKASITFIDDNNILIGFDPVVCYLKELRSLYSNIALFFHDKYGGTVIGIVWKPSYLFPTPWKVNLGYSSKLWIPQMDGNLDEDDKWLAEFYYDSGHCMMTLDTKATVMEMERLGEGLVIGIDFRK